ncbi:MAG: hypothetical protein WBL63_19490 [Candidatus Acidiferrum sp.]
MADEVKLPKTTERRVKYEILAAVGPGRFLKEGGLADLLFEIPYFFLAEIIPPIGVVNEILNRGTVDAGMSGGCKWKPFQVDRTMYAKLVVDLKKLRFRVVEPPDWERRIRTGTLGALSWSGAFPR